MWLPKAAHTPAASTHILRARTLVGGQRPRIPAHTLWQPDGSDLTRQYPLRSHWEGKPSQTQRLLWILLTCTHISAASPPGKLYMRNQNISADLQNAIVI